MNLQETLRRPRVRKAAIAAGVLLALWAVVGFLVLPAVLRPVVERKIGSALHRKATLRELSINPFALSATLTGLDVKDRDGVSPFLSFDSLSVNVETVSIVRGGPVLRAVTLVKPAVTLVRNADGTYNVQDLLGAPGGPTPKPKDEKPLVFSLNNIRVEGGRIDFDDRPLKKKHEVRDIRIGIPFLSNIPSKVEITTQPEFEAKVNGAPFSLRAKTKPFSGTHETTLDLDLSDVDVPYYLAYLPSSIEPTLRTGRFDAKLVLAFTQPPKGDPALVVSGTAALRKVAVELQGKPLFSWERLEAAGASIDVFGRRARIGSLTLAGPESWIRRETTGEQNVARALAAPSRKASEDEASSSKAPASAAAAAPFRVEVAEARLEAGRVHYDDFAVHPPFHALVSDVSVSLEGFTTEPGKAATLEASARGDAGESLRTAGTLSLLPAGVSGTISVEGIPLKRYAAFVDAFIPIAIDGGVLSLKTGYTVTAGKDANTTLTDLAISVTSARVRKKSEKEPFFTAARAELTGSSLDVAKRAFVLGNFKGTSGLLAVVREKDGNADLMALAPKADPRTPPSPPSAPWDVTMKRFGLTDWTFRIEDRTWDRPARYALTKTDLLLEGLSTAKGSKGKLAVRFGIDSKGAASAEGRIGTQPIFANLKVGVKAIDLVPLEPYVLPGLDLRLARGILDAGGTLSLRQDTAGKASVVWAGNVLASNLLTVDSSTQQDFLKWDTVSAAGMRAGYNPLFLEIKQLAAVGVSCDITIEPDGTMNLRKVVRAPAASEDEPPAAPVASVPGEKDARLAMPVRIDEITLQGGRIGLADRFVKPNYAATLGDLGGRVTGLSSEDGTVAALDVRGSLGSHAPLHVSGTINPLAAATFADISAKFEDIDLPPMTPYAGKYAGYAIASGSLTFEATYKVANRKLTATNHFVARRFDLGEKIESKDATKLPVRLAVSLLKDKDGLIDLDLPIEGSLDDPTFRIGKVVWKVLSNLIGKAATAPFALIGNLFGGKGEEASFVEFPDGIAAIDAAGREKLDALAKALRDRPALTLEATGRFSGEPDLEGLRRARVDRKLGALKLADLEKSGAVRVDDVVVEAGERAALLAKAYRKEKFPKPKTALGRGKDLSPDEMEKLLLANEVVGNDDLRALAFARANAVKDYLAGPGAVEAVRVFVREPGTDASVPKDKARASRVDFGLK